MGSQDGKSDKKMELPAQDLIMMETGILCPFCNARIDGLVAGAKAVCPRCDAALPASIVAKLGNAMEVPRQTVDEPSASGKKKTALAIVGIMALMAAVTVAF